MQPDIIRSFIRLAMLTCCVQLFQGWGDAYAVNGLTLVDASFALRIADREPSRVSQSVRLGSLGDSRLWFWLHLTCTGACEQKIAPIVQQPRECPSLLDLLQVGLQKLLGWERIVVIGHVVRRIGRLLDQR